MSVQTLYPEMAEDSLSSRTRAAAVVPGRLSGKVALVTGGSRGIGAAVVRRLAVEGASVAFTYASSADRAHDLAHELKDHGASVQAVQADSADARQVERAVEQSCSEFGRLDILVNNAGVLSIAPIDQFSLEDFDRLVSVNVRGVFIASKAAAARMERGGRIIHIGSVNAEHMPFAGGSVYALTKAAVAGFTRGLARDLGPRGITVNNIQPGPVDTEMNPASGPFAEMMVKMLAVGRYGRDEEIAGLAAYLASDEAGFVTGSSINIDGGFAA